MKKTDKELAYLWDLYIAPEWTRRFTENFDKNFKFDDEKEILYLSAGTGAHVLELTEKLGLDIRILGYNEDEELNVLARGKAEMAEIDVEFSGEYPRETFDLVIADASLVSTGDYDEFLADAAELARDRFVFFMPTAGSFGEIYSLLWEAIVNAGVEDAAGTAERLIAALPQVSQLEAFAQSLGLKRIKTYTTSESLDFENGAAFVSSPLANDLLFPMWLDELEEADRENVLKELEKLIDESSNGLSFRFAVKATVIVGDKEHDEE